MKLGESRTIREVVTLPKKCQQEKKLEFNLFKDYFDLILKKSELIINTPKFYHSYLNCSTVGLAYFGSYQACIGALLQLWQLDMFVNNCEKCRGKVYLFQGGGSPLSGRNKCMGICGECRMISCRSLSGAGQIVEAFKHIKHNINTRIIEKTRGQAFSFKYGLVGQTIPDRIVEEGVKPVTITELINALQEMDIEREKSHRKFI